MQPSPTVQALALDITLLPFRDLQALASAIEHRMSRSYTRPPHERLIQACEDILAHAPIPPLDDDIPFYDGVPG